MDPFAHSRPLCVASLNVTAFDAVEGKQRACLDFKDSLLVGSKLAANLSCARTMRKEMVIVGSILISLAHIHTLTYTNSLPNKSVPVVLT